VEDGVLLAGGGAGEGGGELGDGDVGEVPTVGAHGVFELGTGLGQGNVEAGLAERRSGADELHGEGGLAGAWVALEQIDLTGGHAAEQDVVEAGCAGVKARDGRRALGVGGGMHGRGALSLVCDAEGRG
jgi:hypothetical protein